MRLLLLLLLYLSGGSGSSGRCGRDSLNGSSSSSLLGRFAGRGGWGRLAGLLPLKATLQVSNCGAESCGSSRVVTLTQEGHCMVVQVQDILNRLDASGNHVDGLRVSVLCGSHQFVRILKIVRGNETSKKINSPPQFGLRRVSRTLPVRTLPVRRVVAGSADC